MRVTDDWRKVLAEEKARLFSKERPTSRDMVLLFALDSALSHAAGQEAVVSARDVFRIAGGDTECCPNPSAKAAMDCLIDLRACYDEAIAPPTNPAEIGRKSVDAGQEAEPRDLSWLNENVCAALHAADDKAESFRERALRLGDAYGREYFFQLGRASAHQEVAYWLTDIPKLTPAQPPASAEAVDLLHRTVLAFRYVYDETCTAGVLRADIERYLAASSGRKGGET